MERGKKQLLQHGAWEWHRIVAFCRKTKGSKGVRKSVFSSSFGEGGFGEDEAAE